MSCLTRYGLVFVLVAAFLIATGGAVHSAPHLAPNLAAAVAVSPAVAVPNQQIFLSGSGFTPATVAGGNGPAGVHQITGLGSSGIIVSGSLLTAPHVNYPVDLDSNGNWGVSVVVPVNEHTLSGGFQQIKIIDDNGVEAIGSYTLPTRTFSLNPSTSPRNSVLTVIGTGFPASNGLGTGETPILIEYAGNAIGHFSADANGNLSAIVTVPVNAAIPSTNVVKATISGSGQTNSVTHGIPGAMITLSPDSGPAGSVAAISGTGFPGFVPVSAINADGVSVMPLPGPNTNSLGEFSSTIIIPDFPVGSRAILTTAGGVSVVSSFKVTDASAMSFTTALTTNPGVSIALEDVTNGDNLLRVWSFNNATKEWFFFDPRPAFTTANTLTEMVSDQPYWIIVVGNQTAILNGKPRSLYAGWNLVPW